MNWAALLFFIIVSITSSQQGFAFPDECKKVLKGRPEVEINLSIDGKSAFLRVKDEVYRIFLSPDKNFVVIEEQNGEIERVLRNERQTILRFGEYRIGVRLRTFTRNLKLVLLK